MNTYSLLVRVHISNAKVVFLQQVKMVADEVEQVLSLGIPLKENIEKNTEGLLRLTVQCKHSNPSLSIKHPTLQNEEGALKSSHSVFKSVFFFLSGSPFFGASEKSKRPPEHVLIFYCSQGRYMRAMKYSYWGSSHLWKLKEISAAGKSSKERCKQRNRQAERGERPSSCNTLKNIQYVWIFLYK